MSPAIVDRWLSGFDPIADDVRILSNGLSRLYADHVRKFRQTFPAFDPSASVIVLPSLFGFDAHVSHVENETPLFIGPDGVVRFHGPKADLSVLLDHESFHLVQNKAVPEFLMPSSPPVWVRLWLEGCAVYASAVLNPSASRLHVLLDQKRIAAASPDELRGYAGDMLSALESTDDADHERFFSYRPAGDQPAMTGYLVGYEALVRIGRRKRLSEIADLKFSIARDALRAAVLDLSLGKPA